MNTDNFFHNVVSNPSDVSTPEVLTEQQKQDIIAWAEFEAYMREMETENNFTNTYK